MQSYIKINETLLWYLLLPPTVVYQSCALVIGTREFFTKAQTSFHSTCKASLNKVFDNVFYKAFNVSLESEQHCMIMSRFTRKRKTDFRQQPV